MNQFTLFFIILNSFCLITSAQSQFWPYGMGSAISINQNGTVTTLSSSIETGEGSASIQDESGEVLFYTNGAFVYDKAGTVLNANDPLFGTSFHPASSTQGAAILPLGDCNRFLIISTPGVESIPSGSSTDQGIGVAFVYIDNQGAITVSSATSTKIISQNTICEKLAIYGKDGDYWIIAKQLQPGSNRYYKWNLNASSMANIQSISDAEAFFNSTVQIQEVGRLFTNNWSLNNNSRYYQAQGQLKFSPDGTKMGQVYPADKIVELFDFDSSSGLLSNSRTYNTGQVNLYGFEFNPSGQSFFVSEHYQGTRSNNRILQFQYTNTELQNPSTLYTASNYVNYAFMAMQLAIDGNIYIAGRNFNHLVRIENSDSPNPSLNTSDFGTASGAGLPLVISGDYLCGGCTSTQNYNDSFCEGDSFLLESSNTNTSTFLWNTGETTNKIIIYQAGQYICKSISSSCIISDTFNINITIPKTFNLGSDTTLCSSQEITIYGPSAVEYKWSDGSTNQDLITSVSGIYSLEVTDDNFCKNTDSIQITLKQDEFKKFIDDTLICDSSFELTFTTNNTSTTWNNTLTSDSFTTSRLGVYWLEITDSTNCILRDTFQLSLGTKPDFSLDTFDICRGEQINVAIPSEYKVRWFDGDTLLDKILVKPGNFSFILTSVDGCDEVNSVYIVERSFSTQLYIPNAFTPNGDNLNETFPGFDEGVFSSNFSIQIFSRWGEKIYESYEMNDWNGFYKDKKCQQGVYVYLIRFTDCNGNSRNIHGNITLVK
jgi:gliding motility-associated-like protein